MAKYIAQIILAGSRILGRAFAQALKEEYAASQRAANARQSSSAPSSEEESIRNLSSGMSLQEAKLILNVKDIENKEDVLKKYEHLFAVNDKAKGGSLYLQSKVYRAKERIDTEISEEMKKDPPGENQTKSKES